METNSQKTLSHHSLSVEQIADLRLAARRLKGAERRAFMAEITLKYCGGKARLAETILGWGRETVAVGLAEKRSGIMCLGAHAAFGGELRWEVRYPEAAAVLCRVAEAHTQQDPTFRTTLTYTRLTAEAARAALREHGVEPAQIPAPSTMAKILNRLGYRLRQVVKAKPQKKIKETDAIFENIKKKSQIYQKGVTLTKKARRAVETRLERNPALPKWDILIWPAERA